VFRTTKRFVHILGIQKHEQTNIHIEPLKTWHYIFDYNFD